MNNSIFGNHMGDGCSGRQSVTDVAAARGRPRSGEGLTIFVALDLWRNESRQERTRPKPRK
jgi:hypothetical protein